MAYNVYLKNIGGAIADALKENKKTVLCVAAVFAAAMIIGVMVVLNVLGGDFSNIEREDMSFGAVTVFFVSTFCLLFGYAIVGVSSFGGVWTFVALLPFAVGGFFFGEYCCVLIARYGAVGIINLLFIYVPFFVVAAICLTVAVIIACRGCAVATACRVKSMMTSLLKVFILNVAINFVFFVIIGSFVKVLVVSPIL